MEAKTYKIVSGPNVLFLLVSLFRRTDGDKVYFGLHGEEQSVPCFITGAESVEEENTINWKLKGFFKDKLLTQNFVARYSMITRKGTFKVLKSKDR